MRMTAYKALAVAVLATLFVLAGCQAGGSQSTASDGARTPVVLFPAFHLTKLQVTVHDQVITPECPRSGSFEDWFRNDHPSTTFSQVCQDRLLTLRYDATSSTPMPVRFSNQPGVTVEVENYGTTESAPFYEPLYKTLESNGYRRDRDIRVAGYDSRLTPDIGDFLQRTQRLIEDTYRDNGNRPVHLIGHSNGPVYTQYLLTHTTGAWRAKYVHGFTSLAGNFPGQGLLYPVLFTGLNIEDFGYPTTTDNAASSARLYQSAPSTYLSAADPTIFGDRETVIEDASTGRTYTPRDYGQLISDANLGWAKDIAEYYLGFVKIAEPGSFPNVDVYAEKGSGVPTVVGARLANLTSGQVVVTSTKLFTRDGDGNQEDITNNAVLAWRAMRCAHFSLTDNPGVDHFSLPSNPNVLHRLVVDLTRPPQRCR
ncbi:MAG: lipase/acyltransferase domain-containing protein [Pseudonocardiaceae bacterium]